MKIEVFGKQGCAVCQSTKNKLSHFLEKWGCAGNVPLDFVDMETVDGLAESAFRDVIEIPTTIVSDDGAALARWDGTIPPSEDLKKALERCHLTQSR